jgi:hypothetical protein
MNYDISKCRRDFCIWAAFRAAQAGSAKVKGKALSSALDACGLFEFLDNPANEKCDEQQFNEKHRAWVSSIRKHIRSNCGKDISYGIAAKLVAVFIKGYFILAGKHGTRLASVAHPPIDRFLLKGIDEACGTNLYKKYKWTKLHKNTYLKLLSELRKVIGAEPFWSIEKYWKL